MEKVINKIHKICDECDGEGVTSCCCDMAAYKKNNTYVCSYCNKFCKVHYCCEGDVEFKVGTKVRIYVCTYTPEYLKDLLYKPKKLEDSKHFYGEIVELCDDYNALVKIKYRRDKTPIKFDIQHISLIE